MRMNRSFFFIFRLATRFFHSLVVPFPASLCADPCLPSFSNDSLLLVYQRLPTLRVRKNHRMFPSVNYIIDWTADVVKLINGWGATPMITIMSKRTKAVALVKRLLLIRPLLTGSLQKVTRITER